MKERIITGVILGMLALWAILGFSLHAFEAVMALVLLIAADEWASAFLAAKKWYWRLGYVALIAALALVIWSNPECYSEVLAIAFVWWVIALILIRFYSFGVVTSFSKVLKFFMGFLVIEPAWAALIILKEQNSSFLIFVILAVVLADSGAYFTGRFLGKHKLAPVISPKKTWEGLAGGIVFSLIGSIIFALALRLSTIHQFVILMILGVLIVFCALFGDLFESMLKREAGIKDSGNILPGHGGILDRLDSLFIALPLFVFFAQVLGFHF